jgi:hypothetical protein
MKRIIKSHDSMNGSSIFQARSTARRFLIYRGQIIHAEKSRKIISQNHNFAVPRSAKECDRALISTMLFSFARISASAADQRLAWRAAKVDAGAASQPPLRHGDAVAARCGRQRGDQPGWTTRL